MNRAEVAIQIKSLRAQLDVLEAKLRHKPDEQAHSLADLKGMLASQSQSSEEEIDAVIYRVLADDLP